MRSTRARAAVRGSPIRVQPALVGGCARFRDVLDARRECTPASSAERDDLERLTQRGERANQLGRIAPNPCRGRAERMAVETDAE